MKDVSALAGIIEWWYPVAVWAIVFAAIARAIQTLIESIGARRSGPRWLPIAVAALAIMPVAGLPLGRWLHGFNANFSIPFFALLLDFTTAPLLRRPLFDAAAKRAALWFGVAAGLLLYPAALGLGPFDPYTLGWRSPGVAAAAAVVGAGLVLRNNAFGIVLLAAGGFWQLGCLESDNAWDYLIDPIYWLLSIANLICGWLAKLPTIARGPTAGRTAAMIALVFSAASSKEEPKTASQLDKEWANSAASLERRATAGGSEQLATLVRGWHVPAEADRQIVLAIPARLEQPDWIDTAEENAIWRDFCDARRARAAGLFTLAVTAARAHARVPTRAERAAAHEQETAKPPLDQQNCAAIRLLYATLREDPEHERARAAGGWVKRDARWVWPEAARRLDRGEEFSTGFGWLPKGRRARYEAGERYDRGRWVPADAIVQPRNAAEGWKLASDHWQITSTASLAEAAGLARTLEETHTVWRQIFGGFISEPGELERLFEGRGRPAARDPFAAMLLADREQYIAALEELEPAIARTLGIYWTPTRTAWFFDPQDADGGELSTVHHEATHQLFAEMRKTSPLAGERCGFWAIEAAACYMESLVPTEFGWTLGGRDAGRAPAARERLIDDGFYVPLEELCSLGRRELQAEERLPEIYSQISGLADFFMNGEQARYREAFVEYLVRLYTGTVDPDTLAKLCGKSYADLDDAYRRHMAR
jgi:hypothetical protein